MLLVILLVSLLLQLQVQPGASQIDPTEYAALRVVRNSLQDLPGSTFFSTWDFTLDPCSSFRGVVCTSSPDESPDFKQHVLMLSLGSGFAGSPGLSGHLSPAIGALQRLRVLTLVPGSVRGSIPAEIGSLTGLEFLGISKNSLTGSIPGSLRSLTSLQGLDLSNNKLSGEIPFEIYALPSLMMLILSSNEFSGGIPRVVSAPLQRLSLDRNQISGGIPQQLPGSLTHLDLSRNSFSGTVAGTESLYRLSFMDLSFNRLTGPIPGALFNLPELSDLLLQRNRLSGSIEPQGPVRISRVDLSHNFFTGSPSPLLATARSLFLNNNKLSGDVPGALLLSMAAGDLQNLYLQHNFLRGIQQLQLLPQFLPGSCVFCIQYNCLQPPLQSSCPSSTGKEPSRPDYQCGNIEGDWD